MARFRPRGTARPYDPLSELVFERGQGPYVWDADDQPYLDMICGYSACNLGHAHPRLVHVAAEQMRRLAFAPSGQSTEREALEQSLGACFPFAEAASRHVDVETKVWLSSNGARAIEVAVKIAHAARPGSVARFDLGFHGRSLATGLLSDTQRSAAIRSDAIGTVALPFPRATSQDAHDDCQACNQALAAAETILREKGKQISMLLIEPAIGSRGYFFAPPWFFRKLVGSARAQGVLIVSDEIQMGLGRMGAMSVALTDDWQPDLVVLGKSLGGALVPISAVVGRAELLDRLEPGIESETFAATPLACRIAREVLAILTQEVAMDGIAMRGDAFRAALKRALPREVRVDGRGLASVLSLDRFAHRSPDLARAWVQGMRQRGLLVHLTGPERNRLALIPPLNIASELLDEAVEILSEAWASMAVGESSSTER